ncbi:MAG: RNase adapter RapZ [Clostridia bacterium]|nr:RNase adapter RapZ [Clostridia bacterium]MBR5718041.1 RNase adapter RapZ [Clostridia bacterium]
MHILIVTGLSGAGKSSALRILEDYGFLCVDNIPSGIMNSFLELSRSAEPPVERVALVIDSRTSSFRYSTERMFQTLDRLDDPHEILFLDCSNEILQRRYSETRRRHPMHDDISAGILIERELLEPIKERSNYIIDTSEMSPREFRRTIESIAGRNDENMFRLVITSFGFKRGIPLDADIVIDMRYTANPFYEVSLRNLSGRDKEVYEYVMMDENVRKHLKMLKEMLYMLIPAYEREGKRRLMVSFGCTGGRHRSVAMAEALYNEMKNFRSTTVQHRDLAIEAQSISERFET